MLLCELTGDHDHSYASLPTHSDRAKHFFPGGVQHAHTAYKGQVRLGGDGGKTCRTSSASPLFIRHRAQFICQCTCSVSSTDQNHPHHHHHLIVCEGSRVLKVEAVNVGGCVSGCHGEATQRVSARSPFPHGGQELLSNRRAQRHASRGADPDIITALQHALWSSLRRRQGTIRQWRDEEGMPRLSRQ